LVDQVENDARFVDGNATDWASNKKKKSLENIVKIIILSL